MATVSGSASRNSSTQATKQVLKSAGSSALMTSLRVSWEGRPSLNGKNRRRKSRFFTPQSRTSTKSSAPASVAQSTSSMISGSGETTFQIWRGSLRAEKCAIKGRFVASLAMANLARRKAAHEAQQCPCRNPTPPQAIALEEKARLVAQTFEPGVRTLDALHAVVAFFEERRGRLYGFRFHDRVDGRSCAPSGTPAPTDQRIGADDGATTAFRLVKTYGGSHAPYARPIAKPVAGSVRVAVNGVEQASGTGFACDPATGLVTLAAAPPPGAVVTAGFAFDVPVRFDTDELEIDLSAFEAGAIPHIPLIEITP